MDEEDVLLLRFGERLRSLRQARGWSQEDFAAMCQLDRTYISGIERGKRNVCLKNLNTIANALELPLSFLLEGI
jgi:transcriptional regulator with XRE-family HTH domain